jgi:hypothetical protein
MKCIHCGSDTKGKDRKSNGGKCGKCYHRFAFEPTTDPLKITDGLFKKMVTDVSADESLFFTDRQLWYEFNRRILRKFPNVPGGYKWGAAACGVGGVILAFAVTPPLFLAGIAGAVTCGVVGARNGRKSLATRVVRVDWNTFLEKYLSRYIDAHGQQSKMIRTDASRSALGPVRGNITPPDLSAYSFDRALITDHAAVAQMLVANRFHFENNCAILSFDQKFPDAGRFATIRDMLRRNPRLAVYALHDASVTGVLMAGELHGSDWFPEAGVRVIDLGLRPKHVMGSGAFVLERRGPVTPSMEVRAALAPEEVAWLAGGFTAETAALRPARLMRAIYQGFARTARVGDDGAVIISDSGSGVWVHDGGADVYAADSFG